MHELSVCQALVSQLTDIASDHPGKQVVAVHLKVGPLSGIVPRLLEDAFPVASMGTVAEHAELKIAEDEIRVHCPSCGRDSVAAANRLVCAHCDEWQTELVSGDALLLERVELDEVQPAMATAVH